METIDQVNTVLAGGHISQPLRYISSIFIALAAGMIFCFVYALSLSKGRKAKSNELMGAAFTKVEIQNARARFMNQTRQDTTVHKAQAQVAVTAVVEVIVAAVTVVAVTVVAVTVVAVTTSNL